MVKTHEECAIHCRVIERDNVDANAGDLELRGIVRNLGWLQGIQARVIAFNTYRRYYSAEISKLESDASEDQCYSILS